MQPEKKKWTWKKWLILVIVILALIALSPFIIGLVMGFLVALGGGFCTDCHDGDIGSKNNARTLQVALESSYALSYKNSAGRGYCGEKLACGEYSFTELWEELKTEGLINDGISKTDCVKNEGLEGGGTVEVQKETYEMKVYDSKCKQVRETIEP